jgi:hypothetical protein
VQYVLFNFNHYADAFLQNNVKAPVLESGIEIRFFPNGRIWRLTFSCGEGRLKKRENLKAQ